MFFGIFKKARRFLKNLTLQNGTDISELGKVHKIRRNLWELERIWIVLWALESKLQIPTEGSKRRAYKYITSGSL